MIINEKQHIIRLQSELDNLESRIKETFDISRREILLLIADTDSLSFFTKMKFERVGVDPLEKNRKLNLIEQLNQSFTYLASLSAVKYLFVRYPEFAPFQVNLGTARGHDIVSVNGQLIAEVFAATDPKSNQKLKNDISKLMTIEAEKRFVFFMSPGYEAGVIDSLSNESVTVVSLGLPGTV